MSTVLRFREHQEFQRSALVMAGCGAVAGVVAHALFDLPQAPAALAVVMVGTLAGAALAAHDRVLRVAVMATLLGAATAALLLAPADEASLGVAAFAVLSGAALARGLSGRRLVLSVVAGAGAVLLARHVLISIVTAQELASLPHWSLAALAGSACSFVSVLALVPRHLELVPDRVQVAYDGVKGQLRGEVGELTRRGYDLWRASEPQLAECDPSRQPLQEAVLRLLEVAHQWQRVEAVRPETMAQSLTERTAELDQRIDRTVDPIAREQYGKARGALAEQLRYLRDIGTQRERVVARMHAYLAAMEQLRLAIVKVESTDAGTGGLSPLLSEIEALGRDMDSSSEALLTVVDRAADGSAG